MGKRQKLKGNKKSDIKVHNYKEFQPKQTHISDKWETQDLTLNAQILP